MPKASQKAAKPQPVNKEPKPLKADKVDRSGDREVLYPTLQVRVFRGDEEIEEGKLLPLLKEKLKVLEFDKADNEAIRNALVPVLTTLPALNEETVKAILGWQTFEEYRKEQEELGNEIDPNAKSFSEDDDYLVIKDEEGNSVRLTNNEVAFNRPFDPDLADKYGQEMLTKNWALNGETILIGQTGRTESFQHRGVGYLKACQRWRKQLHWQEYWPKDQGPPTLETVAVFGVSESPKVIRTIDDSRSRSKLDVFWTSEHFKDVEVRKDRLEMLKMLVKAEDFLWKRIEHEGPKQAKPFIEYETHTETLRMVERHPTLLKCVRHIFSENKSSRLFALGEGTLNVSAGLCAGIMYLMAASDSNPDDYRLADVPKESKLDMGNFDKARSFWAAIRRGQEPWVKLLVDLLKCPGGIPDVEEGIDPEKIAEARAIERQVLLAKAWKHYVEGHKIKEDDLKLNYAWEDAEGNKLDKPELLDFDSFGGIDLGPGRPKKVKPAEGTDEEPEVKKKAIRKSHAEQVAETLKRRRAKGEVKPEGQSATVGVAGQGDGKPPAPKLKLVGRSNPNIQSRQTQKALEADRQLAAAGNKQAAAAVAAHEKKNGKK